MSALLFSATELMVDTMLDRLERRPSLEQPALEPWRCEVCWKPDDECDGECEQDDAQTRYCDSLDMGQLSE